MRVKYCLKKKLSIQKQSSGVSFNWPATFLTKRVRRHSIFSMNFAKFFKNTSEQLLLSIAIIWQDHFKLNVRKMRATILSSLTSKFIQFIKQCASIKLSHINANQITK